LRAWYKKSGSLERQAEQATSEADPAATITVVEERGRVAPEGTACRPEADNRMNAPGAGFKEYVNRFEIIYIFSKTVH
jgi:hypothetical protein